MSIVYYDGEGKEMNVNTHQSQAFVLSYELLIMNIDGTLAKRTETKLTPQARAFFTWLLHHLREEGLRIPSIALISNQGSVGYRIAAIDGRWGDPGDALGIESVNARLRSIRRQIPFDVEMLVSYAWRNRVGVWAATPIEYAGASEWSRYWRKPMPGMAIEAMRRASVSDPSKALVVGGDKDRRVALAARTDFMNSERFYDAVLSVLATTA